MTMPRESVPNLGDIARVAGVSLATASKALSATPATRRRIADATRSRVLAVAQDLGWKPPVAGRYPRLVALLHPETIHGPIFTGVYTFLPHWLARGLASRGSQLISVDAPEVRQWSAFANRIGMDAVVLIPPFPDGLDQAVAAEGMLGVVLNGESTSGLHFLSVIEEAGLRQLIDHLVDHGHRRLVYLDQDRSEHRCWAERRTAMRRLGQERQLVIQRCQRMDEVVQLVAGGATAVITASSEPAMRTVNQLQRAGWKVPEQVSVASCDDTYPLYDDILSITGIEIPLEDMCGETIRLFGQPGISPVGRTMPGRLRIRRSTGPVTG